MRRRDHEIRGGLAALAAPALPARCRRAGRRALQVGRRASLRLRTSTGLANYELNSSRPTRGSSAMVRTILAMAARSCCFRAGRGNRGLRAGGDVGDHPVVHRGDEVVLVGEALVEVACRHPGLPADSAHGQLREIGVRAEDVQTGLQQSRTTVSEPVGRLDTAIGPPTLSILTAPSHAQAIYLETSVLTFDREVDQWRSSEIAARSCGAVADFDEGLMGVAPPGRPGERDHGACPDPASATASWRAGSRAAESTAIPIKRARTTFTYIAVATQGDRGAEGGVPAGGRTVARAGVLDTGKPGVLQRVRQRAADVGRGLHVQGHRRRPTDSSSAKWTTRPPTASIEESVALGHDAASSRARCGRRTRPRSTATGRSRWPKCTSTTQSVNFCGRSPRAGCAGAKLPASVQRRLDNFNLLITGGFLPQRFRDEMRLEWDEEKQRRFDRLMNTHSRGQQPVAAASSGQFPFNLMLKDLDWRIRTGRPLV